jgi:hypothetical protein
MDDTDALLAEAYDDGIVSHVIRPAAIIPAESARAILVELAIHDVRNDGLWESQPSLWTRFAKPWADAGGPGGAQPLGTVQVAYGTPTRYEITIYRVTVTCFGTAAGWSVESLCDEALAFGGLRLVDCPRAELLAPPKPFRF